MRQEIQSQDYRGEVTEGSDQMGRQAENGARLHAAPGGTGGECVGVGESGGVDGGRGPSRYKEETLLLRPRVREVLV